MVDPMLLGLPPFRQNAVYSSREDLRKAATLKANEDGTKLKVLISQPRRVDRARVYLGCTGNGLKAGTTQCTYRVHATENDNNWQVTKACFEHSHPFHPAAGTSRSYEQHTKQLSVEDSFSSRDLFVNAVHDRAAEDGVHLKTFVDLGKLSRRARFAMCCSHNNRAHTTKSKRCTYSFVAIEYEGIGWRVTQCCFDHKHADFSDESDGPTVFSAQDTPQKMLGGHETDPRRTCISAKSAPYVKPASFHSLQHPFALPPLRLPMRSFPTSLRYSNERLASSAQSCSPVSNQSDICVPSYDRDERAFDKSYDSDEYSMFTTTSMGSEESTTSAERRQRPTLKDLLN